MTLLKGIHQSVPVLPGTLQARTTIWGHRFPSKTKVYTHFEYNSKLCHIGNTPKSAKYELHYQGVYSLLVNDRLCLLYVVFLLIHGTPHVAPAESLLSAELPSFRIQTEYSISSALSKKMYIHMEIS